jgi:hypothetical protein
MTERERDFADAARIVDESLVMRAVERIVAATGIAIANSRVAAFVGRAVVTPKGSLSWTVLIATACVTHALLLKVMPDRIAPVKPLAYGMMLAFGAFGTVAGLIATRSSATATADSSAGTANTRKS